MVSIAFTLCQQYVSRGNSNCRSFGVKTLPLKDIEYLNLEFKFLLVESHYTALTLTVPLVLQNVGMIKFLNLLKLPLPVLFSQPHVQKCHILKSFRYSEAFFAPPRAHTVSAVSVGRPLSSAPSNQSPLSQAAPCRVLHRNNEHTVNISCRPAHPPLHCLHLETEDLRQLRSDCSNVRLL